MATIKDVQLEVKDQGPSGFRHVIVTYTLDWSWKEKAAECLFVEAAYLFSEGSDEIGGEEDALGRVGRKRWIRADRIPDGPRTIEGDVSIAVLDEDPDNPISGTQYRDEIFARVSLKPYVPKSVQLKSNIVKDQFGLYA